MARSLTWTAWILGGWLILAGPLPAVQPANEAVPAAGSVETIYHDRDRDLDDASRWIGPQAQDWRGRMAEGPGIDLRAWGTPLSLGGGPVNGEDHAFDLLQDWARARRIAWGLPEAAGFAPVQARAFRGVWHVVLEGTWADLPVYGARVDGKITADGRLSSLRLRLFPAGTVQSAFALGAEAALVFLTDDPSARMDYSRRMLFPVIRESGYELRAAWFLRAVTDRADLRPEGLVDALTGEVFLRYNDVAYDALSGDVHGLVLPMYWDDPPQAWTQNNQWINVTGPGVIYTDSAGHYEQNNLPSGAYPLLGKLQGLYVNVNNDDQPDAQYADTALTALPLNWTWDYTLARNDESNMYWHVDAVHGYFKTLQHDFTALDWPLPATVGYGTNYENAFWNGAGIYFGTGGMNFRNFALFCDVIYHEYVHGVTDQIYPPSMLPYIGQPGAMNEAWSDYFACTITGESQIGEGGLFYSNQPMRDLENNLVFPQNWAGEVHADGRIIGAAFWDLRQLTWPGLADTLLHFAKYALAEQWDDYFEDVLVTDDDDGNLANGGPHHPEIYEAFGAHGIGPGSAPQLELSLTPLLENGAGGSQGNGDGFFDPGEVLSTLLSVEDTRWLYPPAAQGVTVTVSSDDPNLSFQPAVVTLGDIPAGGSGQAADSLHVTVGPAATLRFSRLYFTISANGGAYQAQDSVEIVVGHPDLLLVDDDGGDDYQKYLYSALRGMGHVFNNHGVATQGDLTLACLAGYQTVVWLTGNEAQNTLTAADRAALAAYLDGGGSLLLTGQNLVEDIGGTDFFAGYLKAAPLAGDVNDFALDGRDGDPIGGGLTVMILGAGAGNNQTSPGAIEALAGGEEFFTYHNDPQQRPAAVRHDGGTYRTVTYAFGLEAVSGLAGSSSLPQVLAASLDWLGIATAVPPAPIPAAAPAEFRLLGVHPNPFNPTTALSYELRAASRVSLRIYDTAGREVAVLVNGWREAGGHEVTFDGSELASGVYLVRLEAGEVSQVQKLVLLK